MAIAFVQKQTGEGAAVNSFALIFGSNVTAGNFLSACYSTWPDSVDVAPTGGGTWVALAAPAHANGGRPRLCYAENATGGATTVTVDYGTGFYAAGSVAEFSGLATSSSLDQEASDRSAGDSTPTVGATGTTGQDDELVIAVVAVSTSSNDVGIDAASSDYTNLHVFQNANTVMGHSSDYKIIAAAGTQTAAWGTLAGAYPWGSKIATFKAAAEGGATDFEATGDLDAQSSTVAGSATVGRTSTGNLAAQAAAIAGSAILSRAATGSLVAQSASIAGTVTISRAASGALAVQAATISGEAHTGDAPPVVVTEIPGGTSKRDKKKRKGQRPRYRWEDVPTPEPVMEVVEAKVETPEPQPIEPTVEYLSVALAKRKKANRRALVMELPRFLH